MTNNDKARELFGNLKPFDLPIGVYLVSKEGRFLDCDRWVREILQLPPEGPLDSSITDFYYDSSEWERLIRKIEEAEAQGSRLEGQLVVFRVKERRVFVQDYCRSLRDPETNAVVGYAGYLVDVTAEEQYRKMLQDAPIGFYMIHVENGQDIIRDCNPRFAEIFEFDSVDEVISTKVSDLYANPDDYFDFMNELQAQDKEESPLVAYKEDLKTRKGRRFVASVSCRLQRDSGGNIIGRLGVVRDITEELATRNRLEELVADIGQVLHPYSSTLLMIQHSLDPIRKALGPDPFDGQRAPTAEEADTILEKPAAHLAKSLGKLLELADSQRRSSALSAEEWGKLSSLLQLLKEYKDTVNNIEFRPPILRGAARKVIDICGNIKKKKLPQESVRQVQRNAENLERLACLIALHRARTAILDMDHQVRALRDYTTLGVRPPEPKGVYRLSDLLKQAIGNLTEFSRNQGVDIELKDSCPDTQVNVVERDMVRALTNLLHNAIKYSWSRVIGRPPWISIRSHIVRDQVRVEFENWGVPIPRDEIEKELVLKIGYRGRWSSDRGRLGTGIGLYEARRVAREHGGDVTIKSRPADSYGAWDDYTQPFLTSATLTLPYI